MLQKPELSPSLMGLLARMQTLPFHLDGKVDVRIDRIEVRLEFPPFPLLSRPDRLLR